MAGTGDLHFLLEANKKPSSHSLDVNRSNLLGRKAGLPNEHSNRRLYQHGVAMKICQVQPR
jgi:hypothetical protein